MTSDPVVLKTTKFGIVDNCDDSIIQRVYVDTILSEEQVNPITIVGFIVVLDTIPSEERVNTIQAIQG